MSQLTSTWRDRIWISGATLVALLLGLQIAQEHWLLPAFVVGGVLLLTLYRMQSQGLSKVVLAGLLVGYMVGNRGFAQFMPIPGLPLLPGEAGLGLLLVLLFIERSKGTSRSLFFAGLDGVILAWIVVAAMRMVFDVRIYGVVAVRDFAMVYYAGYYFAARAVVENHTETGRALLAAIRIASVPMAGLYILSQYQPGLFLDQLTFRGVPLIFYKADLVGLYAAIGAVLHFLRFEETRRLRNVVACLLLVVALLSTSNRASLVALVTMVGWVTLAGRWRLGACLGLSGLLGTLAILVMAHLRNEDWQQTPVFEVYEAVISLADPTGAGSYHGSGTFSKGDNNLFRWVWWKLVITDTWSTAPVWGLGFGYDLSAQFEREYYAGMANDFAARSPHCIFITVFARMGLVGLSLFLTMILIMLMSTLRAIRSTDLNVVAAWSAVWALLASASFGVVLEGPMGAVVFWILLGVATGLPNDDETAIEESAEPASPVPSPA